MGKKEKGYIYILTNQSFNRSNWIKIGYSEDVDKRVNELSNTSVPLPFEVYATYEVPASQGMDKKIHSIIEKLNPNLRINSKREFFEIEPWDAYDILYNIAVLHGTTDKLYQNKKNKYFNDPETHIDDMSFSEEFLFHNNTSEGMLFDKLKRTILEKFPDLILVPNKNYVPFKKGKRNVISVWPKNGYLEVVLNAKLGQIVNLPEIVYDISNRLWPAAQYAFKFYDDTDMSVVEDLIAQTYNLIK